MSTIGYYICVPFAWLVRLFYNLTNSYGVALILFTLVIKLIMLPFQMKSKKSMMRMSRVSGQMQELQKRYAKNQAKLQEEMQKLYEEEGVNPMSGCLWSFLPFPILIALYSIIRQPITRFMMLTTTAMQGVIDAVSAAGFDLAAIAMSYGYVYVAQVAMGANPAQTIKAICEAEAYNGPSLIIGYSPCEMHSIKGGMMNCQKEMKKAVECGYWNLFRFNPAAEQKFTLDSKAPAGGYQEFLMNEARYSRLTREFPERADVLFQRNEDEAKARYEHLLKLVEMYDK